MNEELVGQTTGCAVEEWGGGGVGGSGQARAAGGFLSVRRLFLLKTHPDGLALRITIPFCSFLGLRNLSFEQECHWYSLGWLASTFQYSSVYLQYWMVPPVNDTGVGPAFGVFLVELCACQMDSPICR